VCIVEFTGHLLSDRDTTSSTGMGAGVNGNNQWEWERNGNETRLNLGLGMGMGINHWEWEGMVLKKIFPLISTYSGVDIIALSLGSQSVNDCHKPGSSRQLFFCHACTYLPATERHRPLTSTKCA